MPISPQPSPGGTDRSSEGTALIFRAIVRDENRDHILGKEESLTIEVEVKNDGKVIAKDVEVIVSGTAALTAEFPPVLSIGDLLPGEVKRTTSTKRITIGKEPLRGELVLSLRSATPISSVPLAKKFNLVTKPETEYAGGAVPDVDQPPKQGTAVKSPKALVIAMGVGKFRDAQVPPVTYAGRDAETMGTYLRTITNVPEDRVRVLVDEHALKQDMGETFDEWLPKRADSNTVVYVFFSGRALVDGVTGAVSLVPFDGTTTAANRLYSLRRLQESLSRASIQRAILMFDVSLEATPGLIHQPMRRLSGTLVSVIILNRSCGWSAITVFKKRSHLSRVSTGCLPIICYEACKALLMQIGTGLSRRASFARLPGIKSAGWRRNNSAMRRTRL